MGHHLFNGYICWGFHHSIISPIMSRIWMHKKLIFLMLLTDLKNTYGSCQDWNWILHIVGIIQLQCCGCKTKLSGIVKRENLQLQMFCKPTQSHTHNSHFKAKLQTYSYGWAILYHAYRGSYLLSISFALGQYWIYRIFVSSDEVLWYDRYLIYQVTININQYQYLHTYQ